MNRQVLLWGEKAASMGKFGFIMAGRRSGLVVNSMPDSGLRGPGLCPGRGHCVLGQDTLLSQFLSPPRSINEYQQTVRET